MRTVEEMLRRPMNLPYAPTRDGLCGIFQMVDTTLSAVFPISTVTGTQRWDRMPSDNVPAARTSPAILSQPSRKTTVTAASMPLALRCPLSLPPPPPRHLLVMSFITVGVYKLPAPTSALRGVPFAVTVVPAARQVSTAVQSLVPLRFPSAVLRATLIAVVMLRVYGPKSAPTPRGLCGT